jgi:N-acetylneuraminic acid mutarotase
MKLFSMLAVIVFIGSLTCLAGEGEWTKKTDMPTSRCGTCSGAVKGKIYVIGGAKDVSIPLSTVEEYDPVKDTWTKKRDMPNGRCFGSSATVNGKIYVIAEVHPSIFCIN